MAARLNLYGQAKGETSRKKLAAEGWYAQAGIFIIPEHLELAYRHSYYDPNVDIADNYTGTDTLAVNYYIIGQQLKIQAEISNIRQKNRNQATTNDQSYRMQTQICF